MFLIGITHVSNTLNSTKTNNYKKTTNKPLYLSCLFIYSFLIVYPFG